MTNKERLHALQARIKAVLDALNAPPPPPPVPPAAEPTPEPPAMPPVEPTPEPASVRAPIHEAHIVLGQMCCRWHEDCFVPARVSHGGVVRVESILDLQNSLRR